MIKKILVANRGEIAVRIIRSCQEMGIQTVAVFSEADRTSPHVLKADEAYFIGPPSASESYLNVSKILEVSSLSRADAVHPGYGFLSENTDFANAIISAGITWIGPSPDVITMMGDKIAARTLAETVGAPIVPGTTSPIENISEAMSAAERIGYPVLIKAAGGGGGKGMRIVRSADGLSTAIERAGSEAGKAFADRRIYMEKYLEEPHHIEIQALADQHSNALIFGERECSVQRRYQKIIEETPSPFIDDPVRISLQKSALDIIRACHYVGAGTIEFLVDKHKNFYFLEMNTRLQVEHPVTEMVNQIDFVKEQIRIANGERLSIKQDDLSPSGHAIECRIYAEDGYHKFTPSVGTIHSLDIPGGPGVRFDEGIRAGQLITPYYDPLLGKLIAWGRDRDEALNRMIRALSEFHINGLETTIPFCLAFIRQPLFRSGRYCTHTLEEIFPAVISEMTGKDENLQVAGRIAGILVHQNDRRPAPLLTRGPSSWLNEGRKENLQ